MAKKASLKKTSAKTRSAKSKSAKAKVSRRKRQAAPTTARAAKPAPAPAATTDGSYRAKIRMYRQGLGDCFLISLPRKQPLAGRSDYVIMIDCGVILGTSNPEAIMTKVVDDIVATTKGEVDLLVVTHEHWDHVSGFVQAEDAFKNLKVH